MLKAVPFAFSVEKSSQLEKSTPPQVVAVVTNMSYVNIMIVMCDYVDDDHCDYVDRSSHCKFEQYQCVMLMIDTPYLP